MAATASEAIMIELEKEGCEWIKSEKFQKKMKEDAKRREQNNPMKVCVLKYDHFENIHRLDAKLPSYEGAPNFRQVPGYLVFGTGQPTKIGFENALKFIFTESGAKEVLWTNMRQEPVVYLNGQSFTPRLPERMNENMEFPGASGEDIEWLQDGFVTAIKDHVEAVRNDRYADEEEKGKVRYYRDTYAEHPEDRKNIEYSVHLDNDEDLVTLSGLYEQIKHLDEAFKLDYARMPIVDEKAPRECDFDNMLISLKEVGQDTACVFNCQMGKGRTTTGMIVACLVRDVLSGELPSHQPLQADKQELPDEEEFLEEQHKFGNFEILEKIYKYIPEAVAGKAHLDHIIDLCGTPKEGGTGLQNLRECIVWTEEKFNFEPKLKKPFWKQMSKNFIERYCYLVVFATYLRERAPRGFDISFTLWMDIRAEIREIISSGSKNFNFM